LLDLAVARHPPGGRASRGARGEELALFDDLRCQLQQVAAEPAGAAALPSSTYGQRPAQRKRLRPPADGGPAPAAAALPPDEAVAALPLPPAVQRLERAFRHAAASHAFLARSHIQATWRNLEGILRGLGLGGEATPTLRDVRAMAALCPEVVTLQQHRRVGGLPYSEEWKQAAPRLATPAQRAALAAAAAAEAAAPAHGGAIPHPCQVSTDGAGTVVADDGGGAAAADAGDAVVVFSDPWQIRGPLPRRFVQEHAAQPAGGLAAGHELDGDEADGGAAQPERRAPRRLNAQLRKAWAFRSGAVAALALLQARHLEVHPPAPSQPAEPPQSPLSSQPKRRRSRAGQQAAAAQAAAAPPPQGAAPGPPPSAEAPLLLREGAWHPAFPLDAISLEEVCAAAEELSAGRLAARDAAAAAADALAAARALAAAAPPPPPTRTAAPPRPAAPPQLMKKHPPCTDTTQASRGCRPALPV
jgi:hypothetical protein